MKNIGIISALLLTSSLAFGQQLQLGGLSLGMTPPEVRTALGSGYTYESQQAQYVPSISFLRAYRDGVEHVAYNATFIDGKMQAFGFVKVFDPNNEPLASSLVKSVTDKTWEPANIFPPNAQAYWAKDPGGRRLVNINATPCTDMALWGDATNVGKSGYGVPTPSIVNSLSAFRPGCGIAIKVQNDPDPKNVSLTHATILSVINAVPFYSLKQTLESKQKRQSDDAIRKGAQTKSPF